MAQQKIIFTTAETTGSTGLLQEPAVLEGIGTTLTIILFNNMEETISNLFAAIEAATRTAFTELINRSDKERIYSFALYSDEDAVTLCPAANTLEYLEKAADTDALPYYTFEPVEWKYEMEGAAAAFDAISRQLWQINQQQAQPFGEQLQEICVAVLLRLRNEGFFDTMAGREVFLLYHISDYDWAPGVPEKIVTQLNDNTYRQQYLNWIQTWN
ncbi:DUF4303 domain-containing protein [Niabella pedocola]|uniref:DUF4303 domain-containing protein n=1 Tax=Niabella pedocola TaxID=1752077 RepID=A0ABS8PYC7_9BACT|nr:DUF4303 domain-containing protein [Niabella pedocola]MCD2425809.1 DUF4303 domain-containing protein [Niabella pedocola]